MQADLNADVFDYFENEIEFCDLQFEFAGKKYDLFQHSYNCGYFQTRVLKKSLFDCCGGVSIIVGKNLESL